MECNKKVKALVLYFFLILLFYVPFAVVNLKIANAPYSQCLDYTPMKTYVDKNGHLFHSAASLSSYLRGIGIAYTVLGGVLLMNLITHIIESYAGLERIRGEI